MTDGERKVTTATTRITIIAGRRPSPRDIHEELQVFAQALGLFTERDKERSCFRIFIELLKATKHHHPLTSDELAFRLNLARGTVVHHLNKLMEARLVIPEKRSYRLQHENLVRVIEHMQEEADKAFKDLRLLADIIDEKMNQKR